MERQLLERMIGAGVLLVALVVIVPAILDGRPDPDDQPVAAPTGADAEPGAPLRRHTIVLDGESDRPPVAQVAAKAPAAGEPAREPAREPAGAPVKPRPSGPRQSLPDTVAAPAAPAPAAVPESTAGSAPERARSAAAPAPAPAKTRQPAPEPAVPPAAAATGWVVQLGSFSNRANAQGLADKARSHGFESYLMPIERSGKTLYRVRVGPARDTRALAGKLADRLRAAGLSGQVTQQKPDG